jgi:hypothetical protein
VVKFDTDVTELQIKIYSYLVYGSVTVSLVEGVGLSYETFVGLDQNEVCRVHAGERMFLMQ